MLINFVGAPLLTETQQDEIYHQPSEAFRLMSIIDSYRAALFDEANLGDYAPGCEKLVCAVLHQFRGWVEDNYEGA